MSENQKSGKVLGIVGLVLGILAAILAWIPCVNIFAVVPALLAIIFGIVSMVMAGKSGNPKGLGIASLILGIIAVILVILSYYVLTKAATSELTEGLNDFGNALADSLSGM